MPKMFIKVKDKKTKQWYFVQWSTISDEPNSLAVNNEKDFEALHHRLLASQFKNEPEWRFRLEDDLKTLKRHHCSNPHYTVNELLSASDEFKKIDDVVEYCKQNIKSF
jgi:hypothetical protein